MQGDRLKILITGGAGFIGSHAVEKLANDGHAVTVADNFQSSYPPHQKKQNLAEISKTSTFRFHELDICQEQAVTDLLSVLEPEVILHLAAEAGLRRSVEVPLQYERSNVTGTLVLLEAARRMTKKPRFVFASSSSVYGEAAQRPFREEEPNLSPLSPYAVTKLAGEKLCYVYSQLHALPVVCLRLFTVYGPRQRPDLAIHKFIQRIADGRPIEVFGDGSSRRDYTFVLDVVDGIRRALNFSASYEVFNLGSGRPVSLSETIRHIESALKSKARIEWQPAHPSEATLTFASIDKAKRLLGYCPQYSFEEGIRSQVEWWREVHRPALVGD